MVRASVVPRSTILPHATVDQRSNIAFFESANCPLRNAIGLWAMRLMQLCVISNDVSV